MTAFDFSKMATVTTIASLACVLAAYVFMAPGRRGPSRRSYWVILLTGVGVILLSYPVTLLIDRGNIDL